jgi:hypothetical protein
LLLDQSSLHETSFVEVSLAQLLAWSFGGFSISWKIQIVAEKADSSLFGTGRCTNKMLHRLGFSICES